MLHHLPDRLHHFHLHLLHVASTWKDLITATGTAVAALGFMLTAYQLYRALLTLKASNGYLIQKDSREIMKALVDDPVFMAALKQPRALEPCHARKLLVILQFYLSVFRQSEAQGLNRRLARSFGRDLAKLWRLDAVKRTFIANLRNSYDEEYLRMIKKWVSRQEYESMLTLQGTLGHA